MSITRTGPGTSPSPRVAPANESWASSAPGRTSGDTPSRARTPAANTSAFEASRTADVAQNRTASTR